jgi:hypothetical protein
MSALARIAPRRTARSGSSSPVLDLTRTLTPPSAALVGQILAHADIEEDAGAGRVRRRVSAQRLADLEARGLLDASAERAADIAILWDEREGEIVRVLDDAPVRRRAQSDRAWWETAWDEPAPPRPRPVLAARNAVSAGAR